MVNYSIDFLEGWKAARAQYQTTGGVQPHPPEYIPDQISTPSHPVTLGIADVVHKTKLRDEQVPKKPTTRVKKAQGV